VLIVALVARQFLTLADNLSLNRRLVGKLERGNEQLRYQAFHDPLTGLANRALFEEHLGKAVHRCRRSGGLLEVIVIDLHNFKAINDLHGNARGDQLLREVGDRLQATLREADVVARVEGDKFAMLLEGPAGWVDPDAAALRLIENFSRPFGDGANQVVIQAAVGVAVSELDAEPDRELLRSARQALNVARQAGPGSYVRFTSVLHQRILDRARIEIELQRALARDEFVLYYQPVVDLASGEIKGVEALIRWVHPEKGLVPPGMFISVAESSGLIVTIGEWVLRQAWQDLHKWAEAGDPKLIMAVNVSARQLSHPGFEAMVTKVLDDSRANPDRITLEITESMLIHDTAGKADVLERLRLLGIRIALDDFGTGYSSLSSIRDMPIDILKIDKSFIDNIASSPEAVCLAQTIIGLANDLGLATIAEGAETLEQVEVLRDLGCKLVQGYYFSKPVPAPELERVLRNGIGVAANVMA
jgi:diguanylate cyclase (GGDEF)-like protein